MQTPRAEGVARLAPVEAPPRVQAHTKKTRKRTVVFATRATAHTAPDPHGGGSAATQRQGYSPQNGAKRQPPPPAPSPTASHPQQRRGCQPRRAPDAAPRVSWGAPPTRRRPPRRRRHPPRPMGEAVLPLPLGVAAVAVAGNCRPPSLGCTRGGREGQGRPTRGIETDQRMHADKCSRGVSTDAANAQAYQQSTKRPRGAFQAQKTHKTRRPLWAATPSVANTAQTGGGN